VKDAKFIVKLNLKGRRKCYIEFALTRKHFLYSLFYAEKKKIFLYFIGSLQRVKESKPTYSRGFNARASHWVNDPVANGTIPEQHNSSGS
jgi:hypothetical protein